MATADRELAVKYSRRLQESLVVCTCQLLAMCVVDHYLSCPTCSLVRTGLLAFLEARCEDIELVLKHLPFRLNIFGLGSELFQALVVHTNYHQRCQNGVEIRDEVVFDDQVYHVLSKCSKGYLQRQKLVLNRVKSR